MPNRIVKESLCSSEKIASLTDFEFRLWVGLITQARAHHIERYRSCLERRTDVTNGIPLCDKCHTEVHHKEGK